MEITEKELDQLHQLTQARAVRILEKGRPFALYGTEKTIQGLIAADQKSIQFPAGTPINVGQIYSSNGIDYYVSACVAKAGCTHADIEEVCGYAEIFAKHLTPSPDPSRPAVISLKSTSGRLPVLKFEGNEITVPKHFASIAGRVVKFRGMELEAVNARFVGCTAILEVRKYHAPTVAAPTSKTYEPISSRSIVSNAKFYGGYYQ